MSDISTFYGGSVLALTGKHSAIIVSDKRLGNNSITVSTQHDRVYKMSDKVYVGMTLFVPDVQMLVRKLRMEVNLFEIEENRRIDPDEFSSLLSYTLYSHRFSPRFVDPVVAGIDAHDKPYICSMDLLGCQSTSNDFCAVGTAEDKLYGLAEALYVPDMNDDELFVTAMQIFLNAVDRDALSGWGAEAHIISRDRVVKRTVKSRMD
ncbi:20S proteasome, regulatory subunit beta type PSMB3/PUP3 [Trachipleistophora hominis]|uniref:20S proteasome, regulatory subunit beta type PSMB3/PUP3 n=1 Tax=Trachipleistophora hominis TaxID=72359 RepID=L7JUN7_TRAHO|nr:20S proteasome, regulatory subunit beta type PSMB3/PUP3 [Trachipleistophora hominis]